MTYLLTYLPTYLLTYLPTYLLTYLLLLLLSYLLMQIKIEGPARMPATAPMVRSRDRMELQVAFQILSHASG